MIMNSINMFYMILYFSIIYQNKVCFIITKQFIKKLSNLYIILDTLAHSHILGFLNRC